MEAIFRSSTPELVQMGLIGEDWLTFYYGGQPSITSSSSFDQALDLCSSHSESHDNGDNVHFHSSQPICDHASPSSWSRSLPDFESVDLSWALEQEVSSLGDENELHCGNEGVQTPPAQYLLQDSTENGPPINSASLPKKQPRRGRLKRSPPAPIHPTLRCRNILPNPAQLAVQQADDLANNGPKKKRKYSEEGKAKVNEVRRLGACYRCRKLKKPCTGQLPCPSCVDRDKKRLWRGPCTRIDLNDLGVYSTDQWSSLLQSITNLQHQQSWSDEFLTWKVRGGNGPALKFQLRGIRQDFLSRSIDGGFASSPALGQFALAPKSGSSSKPFPAEEFDAFVDGLVHEFPSRIFVTFIACLLKKVIDYAVETKDALLGLALRYYGYCRLAHGFLRGLCYEGYHGGVGVGVWVRDMFKWNEISIVLKMQLLQFASERAKDLEKKLFGMIQARLTVAKKQEAFVPTMLALSILVDQLDCNIHEGIWLEKPAVNMVCPQKTFILADIPTEQLGHALSERASELANAAVTFGHLVTERVLPDDFVPSAKKPPTPDQEFLLTLRKVLDGPRHHLPRTNPVFLERVIFSDHTSPQRSSSSFASLSPSSAYSTNFHPHSSLSQSDSVESCPDSTCLSDHPHHLPSPIHHQTPATLALSSPSPHSSPSTSRARPYNDQVDSDPDSMDAHLNETCSCVEALLKRSIREGVDLDDLLRSQNTSSSSLSYSSTSTSSSSTLNKPRHSSTTTMTTTTKKTKPPPSSSTSSSRPVAPTTIFRPNWAWPLMSTMTNGMGFGPGPGPTPSLGPGSATIGPAAEFTSCNCRRYDYLHNWTFAPEPDCVRCEKMVQWRGQLVCFGRLEGEGPLSRFLAMPQ